jgi:hypothetical protein
LPGLQRIDAPANFGERLCALAEQVAYIESFELAQWRHDASCKHSRRLAQDVASLAPRGGGETNRPLAWCEQKLAQTRSDNFVRGGQGLIEIKAVVACRGHTGFNDELRFRRPPVHRDLGSDARVQPSLPALSGGGELEPASA